MVENKTGVCYTPPKQKFEGGGEQGIWESPYGWLVWVTKVLESSTYILFDT